MKKELNSIKYNYMDPSGNITVLVESEISTTDHGTVSKKIMDVEPKCEQVGFVRKGRKGIRLRMAGGEFCGNAVMSAAALLCDDRQIGINETETVTVESSGCDEPLTVKITRMEDDKDVRIYNGQVDMPLPVRVINKKLSWNDTEYDLPVVEFEGISHILCMPSAMDLSDTETENALRSWIDHFNTECIGIMLISSVTPQTSPEGDKVFLLNIRPLVYVPAVDTCVWEHACASGTTALGAYYSDLEPSHNIRIEATEPGGMLTVTAEDGHLYLSGSVRM